MSLLFERISSEIRDAGLSVGLKNLVLEMMLLKVLNESKKGKEKPFCISWSHDVHEQIRSQFDRVVFNNIKTHPVILEVIKLLAEIGLTMSIVANTTYNGGDLKRFLRSNTYYLGLSNIHQLKHMDDENIARITSGPKFQKACELLATLFYLNSNEYFHNHTCCPDRKSQVGNIIVMPNEFYYGKFLSFVTRNLKAGLDIPISFESLIKASTYIYSNFEQYSNVHKNLDLLVSELQMTTALFQRVLLFGEHNFVKF